MEESSRQLGQGWKSHSPNFDLSRGVTYNVDSADHRPDRVALAATVRIQSAMYAGHLTTCIECIIEHNVNWIRYRIGNQCYWNKPWVTWSHVLSSRMKRTSAFWTRCYGSIVACGRLQARSYNNPGATQLTQSRVELLLLSQHDGRSDVWDEDGRIMTLLPWRRAASLSVQSPVERLGHARRLMTWLLQHQSERYNHSHSFWPGWHEIQTISLKSCWLQLNSWCRLGDAHHVAISAAQFDW